MNLFAQTAPELISPEAGAVLDNGCLDHSDLIIWDLIGPMLVARLITIYL
jgi:hypothetical protein